VHKAKQAVKKAKDVANRTREYIAAARDMQKLQLAQKQVDAEKLKEVKASHIVSIEFFGLHDGTGE
jgi:hypothetical protein